MSNYANSGTMTPLAPCEPRRVTTPNSHSSEQDTLPTTSLISKQAVLYRTRDVTCFPRVSTPMHERKNHRYECMSVRIT
jgi:hypothetical protein